MSYSPPVLADELRAERSAAAEFGVDVDEYRRLRRAQARDAALAVPIPTPAPHTPRIPLDPHTIELGLRKVAELRQQLADQRARKDQTP